VHVHRLAALGGNLAQQSDAGSTLRHGPLEVRNATHYIHAHVQCTLEVLHPTRAAQNAVLREGD
jgi:hypothetical protein